MVTFTYLFFVLLVSITIYISHIFVIFTISDILERKNKIIPKQLYISLLKYLLSYLAIFIFFWLTSTTLYSLIYLIGFVYLGYFIYVLISCFIYKIIIKFTKLSKLTSEIIIFFIPLIITIYSLFHAQKMNFIEETLYYPNFNNTIKIIHLSDLHLGAIYQIKSVEKLVNIIIEKKPDIVVITGDLPDGSLKVENEWLKPFNNIPKGIPILYITGNHENLYGKREILEEINKIDNIKHIGNTVINIKGIYFIGIDYEYKDVKSQSKKLLNSIKNYNNYPTILLYHVPKITPKELNEIGIFLMLAGHTHGGQFFPFTVFSWLYNTCFCGLYNYNDKSYIFVSTGIGTALTPMRFLSDKMIGIINIKGK